MSMERLTESEKRLMKKVFAYADHLLLDFEGVCLSTALTTEWFEKFINDGVPDECDNGRCKYHLG